MPDIGVYALLCREAYHRESSDSGTTTVLKLWNPVRRIDACCEKTSDDAILQAPATQFTKDSVREMDEDNPSGFEVVLPWVPDNGS